MNKVKNFMLQHACSMGRKIDSQEFHALNISTLSQNECLTALEEVYERLRIANRSYKIDHTPFCTYCLADDGNPHTEWCEIDNLRLLIERLKSILGYVDIT